MGKKYLVEEIDFMETDVAKGIAYILGIGFVFVINFFFFKKLSLNILDTIKDINNLDAEIIGIALAIVLSWIIGLIIFIFNIYKGLGEAIISVFTKLLIINTISMILFSIITPMVAYYYIYGTIEFVFLDFLKTLIINSILLGICSPAVSILGMFLIVILSFIISFPLYKVIYILKQKRIKQTLCFKEILNYCEKLEFKNKILRIKLYKDKINFYTATNDLEYSINFKGLGYSDLTPILQLTLIDVLKKEVSAKLKIEDVNYFGDYVLTVVNKNLKKEIKNDFKRRKKQKNESRKFLEKQNKLNEKLSHKSYKKRLKEGKDW